MDQDKAPTTNLGDLDRFLEEQKKLACSQGTSTTAASTASRHVTSNAASSHAAASSSKTESSLVVNFDDDFSDDDNTVRNVIVSSSSQQKTLPANTQNKLYTSNTFRTAAQPGSLHVLRRGIAKPPAIRGRGRGVMTAMRGWGRGVQVATSAPSSSANHTALALEQQIMELKKKIEEKKSEASQNQQRSSQLSASNSSSTPPQLNGATNPSNKSNVATASATPTGPPPRHLDLTKINPSVMMSLSEISVLKLEANAACRAAASLC
mmetsp:Transcript_35177/g.109944  ORF Transcript_35177/g.109944 Transcript_35177/m.109944 type:complete len:265 (-) Transcript_35177:329-1123(-)